MNGRRIAVANLVIYAVMGAFSTLLLVVPGGGLPIYVLLMILGLVAVVLGTRTVRTLALLAIALALAGAVSDFRGGRQLQPRIRRVCELATQRAAAEQGDLDARNALERLKAAEEPDRP